MKFKVGDKVRVIKEGSHAQNIGDTGIIDGRDTCDNTYLVKMDKDNDTWWFENSEIELIEFEVGDIVTINENCTIANLNANNSNGCRSETFKFIEYDRYNILHTYKIEKVVARNCYEIDEHQVNGACLKLVKKKEVKEMTIAEISKALGYGVKIVKEE